MARPRDFGFGETSTSATRPQVPRDNAGVEKLRPLVARDHQRGLRERGAAGAVGRGAVAADGRARLDGARRCRSRAGGVGMKMVAVAALAEEIGRAALPSPLHRDAARDRGAARGDAARRACARAHRRRRRRRRSRSRNERGSWEPGDTDVDARSAADDGVTLQRHRVVRAGRAQGARLLWCRRAASGGVGLYVVAADAPGVTIQPDRIVDLTRDQATRARSTTCAVDADRRRRGGKGRAPPRSRGAAGDPDHRRRRHLRRRRVAAADHHRVRPDAQPVRSPDRLLPGGQAPARQHDDRRSIGRAR